MKKENTFIPLRYPLVRCIQWWRKKSLNDDKGGSFNGSISIIVGSLTFGFTYRLNMVTNPLKNAPASICGRNVLMLTNDPAVRFCIFLIISRLLPADASIYSTASNALGVVLFVLNLALISQRNS